MDPNTPTNTLTPKQEERLRQLCESYGVKFDPAHYWPAFDLPPGWVNGWVGGYVEHGQGSEHPTLFVGVSPEGESHS